MKYPHKSATKATIGTGLSFAVAGSSLFTLTPAIANGVTECTDTPQEIASGIFEVVCDTVGSGTWTPPENVTALEALLIGGGGSGTTGANLSYGGGAGQVVFVTNLDLEKELSFKVADESQADDNGDYSTLGQNSATVGYANYGEKAKTSGNYGGSSAPVGENVTTQQTRTNVSVVIDVATIYTIGGGSGGTIGTGVIPSSAGFGDSSLWPSHAGEPTYAVGGDSRNQSTTYGSGGGDTGVVGEQGAVIFRYTFGSSNTAPAPYSGLIITDIGEDNIATPYQTYGGQTVRVDGDRLSGVNKVFIDGKEGTVVSTADDHFVMISPEGLTPGTYDLVVQSSIGNLTYLDGFVVTDASAIFAAANAVCEGVEPSWWTQRISDTQAKAYIKCPEVGQKYRILQQTGGSGDYTSIFARTLIDENDQTQVFNEFGRYIVRTIDLEDINRLRITVDDEGLWKVRYNNPPTERVRY